jgi:PAS domain S-box-containing protein
VIPLRPGTGADPATTDPRVLVLWRTSLSPLFLVDDDRRHVLVNELAGELLGAPVEAIVGRRIDDFTPPELRPQLAELWATLERDGELSGPYELERADGTRVLAEFRATRDFARGRHLISAREIVAGLPAGERPELDAAGSRLSAREREVLQLAADGGSTRAIADILVLSPGTVKTHFEHAYAKLGVCDRAAAVAEALRRGLIR